MSTHFPPYIMISGLLSLLPILAKVFESIVGKLLLTFLEPNLDDNQFGRSTTHAIVALLHSWMPCLDAGGSIRTVFVDFCVKFLIWSITTYFSINSRRSTTNLTVYLLGLVLIYQTVSRESEPASRYPPGGN